MAAAKKGEPRSGNTRTKRRHPIHKRAAHVFVNYFVPHKVNAFKPYFLRIEVAGGTALVILGLFFLSAAVDNILLYNTSPQVAAVVSATLVDLTNTDRTQNGLAELAVNSTLQRVAQMKADDMAAKSYFAHDSPDGHDPWYWYKEAGYDFSYAGENLAVYFSDSSDVNTAWMNSVDHRANLLNTNFTEIGIATAEGVYQGRQTVFVVQEFGAPAQVAVAAQPQPQPQVAAVSPAQPTNPVANAPQAPKVAGESTQKTVSKPKVIVQTHTFIAVKNENAPKIALAQNTAGTTPNPTSAFSGAITKVVTSPYTDLRFIYEIIAGFIALAIAFEIGFKFRTKIHPHRIAYGLSLVCLMVFLVYAGQFFFTGTLQIV